MEGISQIGNPREVKAFFHEYWETGRRRMNDDVVAAINGLLAGGATEVVVLDNHASGNRSNLIADVLPERSRLETWNVFDLRDSGVEAMLQVGYHARCGGFGFISHTYVAGLRLRVDGECISESHGRAWAADVPLLGIIGNDTHGNTLGSLSDVPYLVVQRTISRGSAAPVHSEPEDSADAIRGFASDVMRNAASAAVPEPPTDLLFEASIPDAFLDATVMHDASWRQISDTSFEAELGSWREARPLITSAMAAAPAPWRQPFGSSDLENEEAFLTVDPLKIQSAQAAYINWISETQTDWLN
jgi:D-amino peptidase